MAFVTTAIAAVGSAFGSATLAGVAKGLLTSVAISALSAALAPGPTAAGLRSQETLTGDLAPAAFILGRFATSGSAICPAMSHGQAGKTPNAYLTYVIALADRPGHQLEALWIDGEEAPITATVETANGYGHELGGEFAGRGWIKYYDGTQTLADPMLLAKYGADPDRPWQADMVGTGLCYAILTFRHDREVYAGFPSVRFVLTGAPLYDPRRDSTAGGSGPQSWSNPATWEVTHNPVVMIYNILRGITLAPGRVWGPGLAAADLRLADWFGAMNVCDQEVAVAGGGTRPRYRAGWEVRATDEPAAVIEELLKTCSGDIADMGGTWRIRAGGPGLPSYILTDDDLLISRPEQFTPFPPVEQIFNAISVTYPGPAMLYETKESPTRRNAAWEAEDGGRYLPVTLDLPACPYFRQAQQVGQEMIRDHRRMRAHGFSLGHPAAKLELLDVISWTSARNGYVAKAFDLREKQEDAFSATAAWTAREKNAADYDWQATDELPDPVPSAVIRRPVAQSVPGFVVQGIAHDDGTGKPRRPAIRLSWDGEAIEDAVAIEWEMRRVGKISPGWQGSMRNVAAGERILAGGIVANVAYEARMRPAFANRKRAWTAWQQATAPAVFVQPEDFGEGETAFEAWMRARGITPVRQVTSLPTTAPADPNDLVNFGGEVYRWNGTAWTKGVAVTDLTGEITSTAIFAQGIRPPEAVATLPTTGNWEDRMVLLTGTGQLYTWRGSAWSPIAVQRDPINPVSTTGTLAGWGGVREDGTGGHASVTFDAAERALTLTSDGNGGVRTDTFPVDHGKIYRVACRIRKTTAGGQHFIGLSGFPVPTAGTAGTSFYPGTEVLIPYLAARVETTPLANFYFLSATTASDAWEDHVYYVIGANRSVMDCPAPVGNGSRPFVKLPITCRHLALRVLNYYNAGVSRVLQVKEVPITEMTMGQIVAANLVDGAVTDAKIAGMAASKVTGQLSDAQIAGLSAAKLAGQITQTQITDGAITTGKLAAASVVADRIATSAITADKVAANAITTTKLAAGAVEAAKIAAGAVQAEKIAAGAVTADKIATNAVTAGKIAAGAVTADAIDAGAVTAGKLDTGAVTAGTVAAGVIGTTELAAGAATVEKLAVAALDNPFLGSEAQDSGAWQSNSPAAYWSSGVTYQGKAQSLAIDGAQGFVGSAFTWKGRLPVTPGDEFHVSLLANRSSAWNGTGPSSKLRFGDQSGTLIGEVLLGAANLPLANTWTQRTGSLVIPAGVTELTVTVITNATAGGLWMSDLSLRRKGGGEVIIDGSLSATKLNTASLGVAGVGIFGGVLASSNHATGSAGWRITQAGDAEFNSLIVRTGMLDLNATAVEYEVYNSGNLERLQGESGIDLAIIVPVDPALNNKPAWVSFSCNAYVFRNSIGWVRGVLSVTAGTSTTAEYAFRQYVPVANQYVRAPISFTRRLQPGTTAYLIRSAVACDAVAGVDARFGVSARTLTVRIKKD